MFGAAFFLAKTPRARWAYGVACAISLSYSILIYPRITTSCRASNERNAFATLRTLQPIQAHFRDHDVDGNGIKDYWRADIAGLYAVKECKLLEISMAGADDRPKTEIERYTLRAPKAGYWYRSLRFAGEATPDPARWAACAFPDTPSAGPFTYLLTHEGVMYRRKGRHPLDLVPTPAELTRDWAKAD